MQPVWSTHLPYSKQQVYRLLRGRRLRLLRSLAVGRWDSSYVKCWYGNVDHEMNERAQSLGAWIQFIGTVDIDNIYLHSCYAVCDQKQPDQGQIPGGSTLQVPGVSLYCLIVYGCDLVCSCSTSLLHVWGSWSRVPLTNQKMTSACSVLIKPATASTNTFTMFTTLRVIYC